MGPPEPSHLSGFIAEEPFQPLFCAIVTRRSVEWLGRTSDCEEAFLAAGAHHGLEPLLYHELRQRRLLHILPDGLRRNLKREATRYSALELAQRHELTRVLGSLAACHIPALLLKGAALAYSHYPGPELRPRVDTDLLIRKTDVPYASKTLEKLGYEPPSAHSGISSAMSFLKRHHSVDLHWRISNALIFGRALSFEELYSRSVLLDMFGADARAPNEVDALIIASIHRAAHLPDICEVNGVNLQYGNRLIWLYDIHLLAQGMHETQWQDFVNLARKKHFSSFCLDALESAKQLFLTPLPSYVVASLHANQRHERIPLQKLRNRTQFFLSDFRVLPTWKERLVLLRRRLFPNSSYVRATQGIDHSGPLPVLYLERAIRRSVELLMRK